MEDKGFQRDLHLLVIQKFGLSKCMIDYQIENLAKTEFVLIEFWHWRQTRFVSLCIRALSDFSARKNLRLNREGISNLCSTAIVNDPMRS